MGLVAVGSVPSVVYRMTATPVPESADDSETVTGAAYQLEQGEPLQAIEDDGGV